MSERGKKQLLVAPELTVLPPPDLHSPGWKILRKDVVTFETSAFTPKSPVSLRHSTEMPSTGTPMPPPMTNFPSAPNLSSPKRSSSPAQPPQPVIKNKKKANSNPSLATTPASLNLPGWKILTKDEPEARAYSAPASPSAATMNGVSSSPSASSSSGWKILQKEPASQMAPSLSRSMENGKLPPGPLLFNPFTIPEETVLMSRSPSGSAHSEDRKSPHASSLKLPPTAAKRVPRASRSSSSPSFPVSPQSPKGLFASTSSSPSSSTSTSNSPHSTSTSVPSPSHSHSTGASPSSLSYKSATPSPASPTSVSSNSHFFPSVSTSLPSNLSMEEKRFLVSTRRAQLWIAMRAVGAHIHTEQAIVKLIFDYVAPQLLLAVLGGYGGFRVYRKTCDVYHPDTRTWESKILPKMPVKTSRSVSCCVGDKLFVIGSSPPNLTSVFVLDLTESPMTWRTLPEPNFGRRDVSVCVFQNEVFVFGGATTEEGAHVCEAYNFGTNTWRTLKSTLNVSDGAACVVGEMIYLVGGSDPRSPIPGPGVRYCQSYRPATGKWADVSPMITKRKGLASCTHNNKIYIFGGYDLQSFRALSSCECYDPQTNTWTALPSMPEPRIGAVACAIGDSIYLSGGRAESLCALATCLQYDVNLKVWSFMPPLPRSRCSHGASLIEF